MHDPETVCHGSRYWNIAPGKLSATAANPSLSSGVIAPRYTLERKRRTFASPWQGCVSPINDLFQEWRTADRQAHAMEQALTRASLDALRGAGPAPPEGERDKAHGLRKTANDLFHLAVAQMKDSSTARKRF
jgi:hypothetical protein